MPAPKTRVKRGGRRSSVVHAREGGYRFGETPSCCCKPNGSALLKPAVKPAAGPRCDRSFLLVTDETAPPPPPPQGSAITTLPRSCAQDTVSYAHVPSKKNQSPNHTAALAIGGGRTSPHRLLRSLVAIFRDTLVRETTHLQGSRCCRSRLEQSHRHQLLAPAILAAPRRPGSQSVRSRKAVSGRREQ